MHLACLQVFTSEVTMLIIQRFILVAFNLVSQFGMSENMKLCMGLKLCLLMSASFTLHNGNIELCFYCLFSYVSFKIAVRSNDFEFQIRIIFYRGILLGSLINWKYTYHFYKGWAIEDSPCTVTFNDLLCLYLSFKQFID
jgi:hypothetical protein